METKYDCIEVYFEGFNRVMYRPRVYDPVAGCMREIMNDKSAQKTKEAAFSYARFWLGLSD